MADHVSPATSPTQGSSRSESSSPTSVRPRARASSADESSKKEVRQNKERKETIEDWEIPIDDIFIGPRIGAGSFGQHQRPLFARDLMSGVRRYCVQRSLARGGRDQNSQCPRSHSWPGRSPAVHNLCAHLLTWTYKWLPQMIDMLFYAGDGFQE